jgi:hypothetical protein
MTLVRLSAVLALALAACAAPASTSSTSTLPTTYRLCTDPQFESMCTPASMPMPAASEAAPIQIDTNLKTPAVKRTAQLG